MTQLLTSTQMRDFERAQIESGAVSGLELMERAGAAVVAAALEARPVLATAPGQAVVLCGPGNNGGDGFVIARLLRARGWQVEVLFWGEASRLPPDARRMHDAWAGPVVHIDDAVRGPGDGGLGAANPGLIVDALFGTGLTRPLPDAVAHALTGIEYWCERHRKWPLMVAVDIPSGLCADSGRVLGTALHCDLTVTFHTPKPGHFLAEGPGRCGAALVVADIGLPATPVTGAAQLVSAPDRHRLGKRSGHKYAHGHALAVSGGLGRSGAARLAARAALRVGAGLVTLAAPSSAMAECAAQLTAIMLRRTEDAGALAALLEDARLNAVCMGPGLGTDAAARALVLAALEAAAGTRRGMEPGRGVVLDADALTQFADEPEALFALTARAGRCVLTPHDGEFARLFPDLGERLQAPAQRGPAFSRLDAARAAAARAGCVVLLKGPDTVIAAPDGAALIHAALRERAAPWLATAGAGDVLAGLIAGLLARGHGALDAAATAAWLHVEAARAFGPGLVAEDLPEALPGVLRRLLA